jgi:HK97 family phage portal protein
MSLWDDIQTRMALVPRLKRVSDVQAVTRSIDQFGDFPDLDTQLLAVQGLTPRPWRAAGLREALGVPALLSSVTLISHTVGSLTMRALKDEVEVPPDDRPRVIIRPDPNPSRSPSEFYRDTAYNLATRGEAWWWVAKRDADGNASALINIPPEQISVSENIANILQPKIVWNGVGAGRSVTMPNRDMRQLTYIRDGASLRGVGPLQLCGAAVSVAVEAQEWAANFYADGGQTGTIIRSAVELDDDPEQDSTEAERFADAWSAKGNNRPRVIDPRIEAVEQLDFNPNGAQMLDARMYQNGDAARMFNIPGTLLEYAMSGSSLTYMSLPMVYEDFLRRCLRPNYLRPIEEAMSDLIPRAFVARFDTDALTLADTKTRYEAYQIGITAGIITPEQAQAFEGLAPGDTDNAPAPFSPPAAQVTLLPVNARTATEVRCDGKRVLKGVLRSCGKLLAEAGPFIGRCPRCGKDHAALTDVPA